MVHCSLGVIRSRSELPLVLDVVDGRSPDEVLLGEIQVELLLILSDDFLTYT